MLRLEKLHRQHIQGVRSPSRVQHVARQHRVEVEPAQRDAGPAQHEHIELCHSEPVLRMLGSSSIARKPPNAGLSSGGRFVTSMARSLSRAAAMLSPSAARLHAAPPRASVLPVPPRRHDVRRAGSKLHQEQPRSRYRSHAISKRQLMLRF